MGSLGRPDRDRDIAKQMWGWVCVGGVPWVGGRNLSIPRCTNRDLPDGGDIKLSAVLNILRERVRLEAPYFMGRVCGKYRFFS